MLTLDWHELEEALFLAEWKRPDPITKRTHPNARGRSTPNVDFKPYIEADLAKEQKALEETQKNMTLSRQQAEAYLQQAQQLALVVLQHEYAVRMLSGLLESMSKAEVEPECTPTSPTTPSIPIPSP